MRMRKRFRTWLLERAARKGAGSSPQLAISSRPSWRRDLKRDLTVGLVGGVGPTTVALIEWWVRTH